MLVAAPGCYSSIACFEPPLSDEAAALPLAYLWFGPPDLVPPCTADAPDRLFDGYYELGPLQHTCPVCSCGPSETTCKGPQGWNAQAGPCDGPAGAPLTAFPAPEGWGGICSSSSKIAMDLPCFGGVPCVQSMIVDPPSAEGGPCEPMAEGSEIKAGPPWPVVTAVRGCKSGSGHLKCGGLPRKAGFHECVRLNNMEDMCPEDYNVRAEIFLDVIDERACSACTCGEPEGGGCSLKVSVFSDEACTTSEGSAFVSTVEGPVCFDVTDGAALRGKKAEQVGSSPGKCAPGGGEPIGQLTHAQAAIWCCQYKIE